VDKINKKTVLLAGGVGGARMAQGLLRVLKPDNLTIIVNVGDDEQFYGLLVCPDIDTILYTLSGRVDRGQGWGIEDDTVNALAMLEILGAPVWMKLGDSDFGLHIWRHWQMAQGATLSQVTQACAERLGIRAKIIPATEERLRTRLRTDAGWVDFQDWFVKARAEPAVREVFYDGADGAQAPKAALKAVEEAELIVLAPSNPYLSVLPILAITGLRQAILTSRALKIGVSPLIGGKAVKGPLDKMLHDMGKVGGAVGMARCYHGMIDGFVVDKGDIEDIAALEQDGMKVLATNILIKEAAAGARLARDICAFADAWRGSA